jgi:hypothetical protein
MIWFSKLKPLLKIKAKRKERQLVIVGSRPLLQAKENARESSIDRYDVKQPFAGRLINVDRGKASDAHAEIEMWPALFFMTTSV